MTRTPISWRLGKVMFDVRHLDRTNEKTRALIADLLAAQDKMSK